MVLSICFILEWSLSTVLPLCSLYFPILIFAVISALKGKRGTVVETGDKTSTHGPPGVEGEYLQGVVGSVSIKFSSSSREPDYGAVADHDM